MTRWQQETGGDRGASYDEKFAQLAAAGTDVHGEAAFVHARTYPGSRVLDAGCGTGRVAIELARRGRAHVVGVDLDEGMLAIARAKAPELTWHLADLADLDLGETFDLVLAAGNVLVLLEPGTEAEVVRRLGAHLRPGGLLVAGFQLGGGTLPSGVELAEGLSLPQYAALAADAGLELVERYAGWDGADYPAVGPDYAVSVHRRVD